MTTLKQDPDIRHHVVIVGGGFGGLYTAQALRKAPVKVSLVDKRNFHLFQPLLYQVATGELSPADIASPLRAILRDQDNATVIQGDVIDLNPSTKTLYLADGELTYDSLVLAAGASNHYFGNDNWAEHAPGLKTIEDAIEIRRQILSAFEAAENEIDPIKRQALMTFVVIGGGPTGVELAGAIAELASSTLKGEFEQIDPSEATIMLLEGQESLLPLYPVRSSANAKKALERLGVTVKIGATVEEIGDNALRYRSDDGSAVQVHACTILWAAGMRATPLTEMVSRRTGTQLDAGGRIKVDGQLNLPSDPYIFTIGDMAHVTGSDGRPLSGVAPVAMQQGRYVARLIRDRLSGKRTPTFTYRDKGNLAVIGRNSAVGVVGKLEVSGFLAWLAWSGIHLWHLVEFDNRLMVGLQWAWSYFTRKRGARLITGRATEAVMPQEVTVPAEVREYLLSLDLPEERSQVAA